MKKLFSISIFLLLALTSAVCLASTDSTVAAPPTASSHLPLTPANAAKYFDEFTHDCRVDGGRLWGVSLCGPMLFVGPATHQVVASHADADGRLKPAGDGMFSGAMPSDLPVANASVRWSGTHWIEVVWPLLVDPPFSTARATMAHEAYHLVQTKIVPITPGDTNAQLQTVYGRYTMGLEWRALAAALNAPDDSARRQAVSDALLFRAARYHRFPKAQPREVALERNEGLAQYTGVMIGNATAAQRKAAAVDLLRNGPEFPSFVRSFAYATGPAYGLLLDRYRPDWRKQIRHSKQGLAAMLASALHLDLAHMPLDTVAARVTNYGGTALLATENARQAKRDRELAHYRSLLITGPVLVLPLKHTRMQFNSQTARSLGKAGTVYPTLRLFDIWGSISVKQGALRTPGQLMVSAPNDETVTGTIHGPGWVLKLEPGWRLVRAERNGDFTVRHGKSNTTQGH